jgi:hypothetical protein
MRDLQARVCCSGCEGGTRYRCGCGWCIITGAGGIVDSGSGWGFGIVGTRVGATGIGVCIVTSGGGGDWEINCQRQK